MQLFSTLALGLSYAVALGSCAPAPTPAQVTAAPQLVRRYVGCNADNCNRQMIQNMVKASEFCPTFTSAVSTATSALPTWVSMCTGDVVSRVSSACSCVIPVATASSSGQTIPVTSAATSLATINVRSIRCRHHA